MKSQKTQATPLTWLVPHGMPRSIHHTGHCSPAALAMVEFDALCWTAWRERHHLWERTAAAIGGDPPLPCQADTNQLDGSASPGVCDSWHHTCHKHACTHARCEMQRHSGTNPSCMLLQPFPTKATAVPTPLQCCYPAVRTHLKDSHVRHPCTAGADCRVRQDHLKAPCELPVTGLW